MRGGAARRSDALIDTIISSRRFSPRETRGANHMSKLVGFAVALFSTLLVGVVSGLRLKPYLDAAAVYTPPTFALYPALIATGFSVFMLMLCQWRRKSLVNIGPVSFTGKQSFAFV